MLSPNGSPPQLLRTTDGQCLCFRELIIPVYSQYRSVSPETTPQHVNYLRRVMTRQLPPPRRRAAWVYARDRCERRRWKDAAPFVEGLRRRGWAVVQPADLLASAPQELCRSFNEADLIVAPHGAHMAYTLCARRDTVVVEMACTQIRDWLASPGAGPYHTALGLRYQFWVGGPPHGSPACNVSKSFSLLTRGRSTLAVDSDFDAGSENLLTLVDKLSRPPPGPPEPSPARLARESPAIVLVLIWTPPSKAVVRAVIRSTLPELTKGEPIEVRFALGNSPVPEVRAMLATEQARCDDLALLAFNETEDKGFARSSSVKLWHTYAWALERRPAAELIFKQDSDALVDWRRALRTMLASASLGGETVPFRHLFLGRICQPEQCPVMLRTHGACVAGMVLGLSRDVVGWILRAASPPVTTDDINVCTWAAEYDDHHPGDPPPHPAWQGELKTSRALTFVRVAT